MEAALRGGDAQLDDPETHLTVISAQATPDALFDRARSADLTRQIVRAALEELPPRDRDIVLRRHLSEEPETLAAVGKSLGISREWVRQLDVRAMERLRSIVTELHSGVQELAQVG